MRAGLFYVVLLCLAGLARPAAAFGGETDNASQYKACLQLIEVNPLSALDAAQYWGGTGGGAAAQHCRAAALFSLRRFRDAAEIYERLASSPNPDASLPARVELLAQGGKAYLLAGQPQKSVILLTTAILQAPDRVDIRQDRAVAYITLKNYSGVLEDLNSVLAVTPNAVDALIFRATAWRMLQSYAPANADIAKALALDPSRQEAYLERGLLKAAGGDITGARTDWEYVIRLNPQSVVANAAQQNLNKVAAGQ
ncbi:MAG: hypothetical protein ACK5XX_01590 [Holosporales bacterium]